jgi:putative ABC transport system substrate-binding protein
MRMRDALRDAKRFASASFIAVIAASALVSFADVRAQQGQRIARVGFLVPSTQAAWGGNIEVFRGRLRELGWTEGRNFTLDLRYANDEYERLPALAAALVATKPDVIVAGATAATHAAASATTTIPIVFETLSDAVSLGLVTNLARPGRNVTGVSGFSPEQAAKRLELIRQIVPGVKRVAVLANQQNPATPPTMRTIESAARALKLQLDVVDVREPGQLDDAFKGMVQRKADALLLVADPMLFGQRQRIVDLAASQRLPAVYEERDFVERGGLLSYGPDSNEKFQQMAEYVDRILRGARPSDLPIQQPTKFELVVNMKAARLLGLTIPQVVRVQAEELK